MFTTKLRKKKPNPSNSKEYYNFYLKRRNMKSVKQSKINIPQLKAIRSPNIADIMSAITDIPKPYIHFLRL